MNLPGYRIVAPIAYIGKEGCQHAMCTRVMGETGCRGYHCSYCDAPCSMMGHRCPASVALIEAAERIHEEGAA